MKHWPPLSLQWSCCLQSRGGCWSGKWAPSPPTWWSTPSTDPTSKSLRVSGARPDPHWTVPTVWGDRIRFVLQKATTGWAAGDTTWSRLASRSWESTRRWEPALPRRFLLQKSRFDVSLIRSVSVEPLPGNVSDWPEGPAVEEPVKDAASLRQTGVQLFPTNLHSSPRRKAAAESLGGRRLQAEVDHQACRVLFNLGLEID